MVPTFVVQATKVRGWRHLKFSLKLVFILFKNRTTSMHKHELANSTNVQIVSAKLMACLFLTGSNSDPRSSREDTPVTATKDNAVNFRIKNFIMLGGGMICYCYENKSKDIKELKMMMEIENSR